MHGIKISKTSRVQIFTVSRIHGSYFRVLVMGHENRKKFGPRENFPVYGTGQSMYTIYRQSIGQSILPHAGI